MAFPVEFVDEVRRAADIVAYVGEQVSLRKMGNAWKGLCPFHNEKTPSFNVRQDPPIFKCFGCGEGGDVFKFAMKHERLSFPEAVETLAKRFGVPIPEGRSESGPEKKDREELLALMEAAADHFQKVLWTPAGTAAREYLTGRGFTKATLERIRAGASKDAWRDVLDTLGKKFNPVLLLRAGLVLDRGEGRGHYDRFRNRAVFPILNDGGKVVAFGARSLDGSEPKYLNSPETPIYHKGRVLYGLSWAKDTLRRENRAVLMEGYLDVARAIQEGVTEAVASCGTALTESQVRLLRRFTPKVIVNFDQDGAGQKAARKSLDTLLEEGLTVQVVELPEGDDPDTFLRDRGTAAYRERLDEAPAAMEWLIRRAAAENDTKTPAGKAAFVNALLPLLSRIESAVERAAWLPRLVAAGGLDSRAVQEELRKALTARASVMTLATPAPAPTSPRRRAEMLPAEKLLLSLLIGGVEGASAAVAELPEDVVSSLAATEVFVAARRLVARGARVDASTLDAELSEEGGRRVAALALSDPPQGVTAADCVIEIRRQPLLARMAEIQKVLNRGDIRDELLAEKQRLTEELKTTA